ncbi:CHASE3 domain-containing protein [Mesorhizobium sp.]|uniref:CHASE3 domain-containing protein n=1 Tax=Mesorhizobium sp. TaxID=1871066 RepID=UPI000FE75269|nr:CHASE3 domain-containing protein [Mesorhizobium sp.]RWO51342.1 MAG: hypothetical protein EOS13_19685 [Mesorhizobium sp.]
MASQEVIGGGRDAEGIQADGKSGQIRQLYTAPLGKLTAWVAAALRKLNIGGKLTVGFGILVALMLLVVGLNYLGSIAAVRNINRTTDLSAPSAVASARAQANLLRMLGEVRGYLALGDESYRDDYRLANEAFLGDMRELEGLLRAKGESPAGRSNAELGMQEIGQLLAEWKPLSEQLFELRNDQLRREPALKILVSDANPLIATVVASAKAMMLAQQNRDRRLPIRRSWPTWPRSRAPSTRWSLGCAAMSPLDGRASNMSIRPTLISMKGPGPTSRKRAPRLRLTRLY